MQSGWRWTVWIVQDKEVVALGVRAASEAIDTPPAASVRYSAALPETGAAMIGLVAPPTLSGGAKRWNR